MHEEDEPISAPITEHDFEGTLAAYFLNFIRNVSCLLSTNKGARVSMDSGLVVLKSTSFGYLNNSEYL